MNDAAAFFGLPPVMIGNHDRLPTSGDSVLRVVLRRHRIASVGRLMFLQWPAAHKITEALAWHLTDYLPDTSGGSLFGACVMNAFEVMAATQVSLPDKDKLGQDVLVAYYAGLFEPVAALPEVMVQGSRGSSWDALASPPLGEWLSRHRPAQIMLTGEIQPAALAFSPPALRLAIMQRVVHPSLMGALTHQLTSIIDPPY